MKFSICLFLGMLLVVAAANAQYDNYLDYYPSEPSQDIVAVDEGARIYDYGPDTALTIIDEAPITYKQRSGPDNALWIQELNQQVKKTKCSMFDQLKLVAYSTGGSAIMKEVYPDGHSIQNYYNFQPGYNEVVFAPDVPGRHTLGYEVNGQLSNTVIIDVIGDNEEEVSSSSAYPIPSSQSDGEQDSTVGSQEREFEVSPGESIQAAIDAAKPGDIIWVKSGTYREMLNINKKLYLGGWDTGSGDPVLDSSGIDNAMTLYADGIEVEGIKIINANTAGINIQSNDNYIDYCSLKNNNYGVYIGPNTRNNSIVQNDVFDNKYGIYLDSTEDNKINNLNKINGGGAGSFAIYLKNSDNNIIMLNEIGKDNKPRFESSESNANFEIVTSEYNSEVTVDTGIYLDSSNNNLVQLNYVFSDINGLVSKGAYNNVIYSNNFINNAVYDDGKNTWYSEQTGNFYGPAPYVPWDGCVDSNNDGICDTAYSIPGGSNVDPYSSAFYAEVYGWADRHKKHK